MIHVIRRQWPPWEKRCQLALTTSRCGCAVTVCNWKPRKPRCCGAWPADGNTRSHGSPHVSAPISCSLSDQYETWAYISTPRLPWRPMFPELFQPTLTDPLHPSICHTPGSSVTCCVSSFVSTRLRQRNTRRFAYPRTKQTSVSPECWCAAHFFGKKVRSRFIATTWPSLVAGAAANRLQDCRSRVSVSARTCSGVPVCWSTEHQGPAVETATTVMVVGHVSHPDVEPVQCWRSRFPVCRCTSLEHSVAGRSVIQFFINFQASAQDWAFLTKLPWLKYVNFRYICKVASQLWLMPP